MARSTRYRFGPLGTLESRLTPVVGAFAEAPIITDSGEMAGVVRLESPMGIGSGALLATGQHILTAAHVVDRNGDQRADDRVTVDFDVAGRRVSMSVSPESITLPREWIGVDDSGGIPASGYDWAVLTLPALAPLDAPRYDLYRGGDEVGQRFTLVGYGRSGTGVQGSYPGTQGLARRLGTNRFDATQFTLNQVAYAPTGATLLADFDNGSAAQDASQRAFGVADLGDGATEASTAPGDSGGPAFLATAGGLRIAGVASYYLNGSASDFDGPVARNNNSFGDFFGYTRVSSYASAIDAIVQSSSEMVVDLQYQPDRQDDLADLVEVVQSADTLIVRLNGQVVQQAAISTLAGVRITDPARDVEVRIDGNVNPQFPVVVDPETPVRDGRDAAAVALAEAMRSWTLVGSANASSDGNLTRITTANMADHPIPGFAATVGPTICVFAADGTIQMIGQPYGNEPIDDVRVALGDINGDRVEDVITAPGEGMPGRVRIFDGQTGVALQAFTVFENSFTGGVFLTVADLDGDGQSEIIVSPDRGGGPRVRILRGDGSTIADFFGIDDPAFRGGARVGSGDLNGDGKRELFVGAGYGGGPRVAVYDGATLGGQPRRLMADFFVFESSLRNGVQLTAGDLNGDGTLELIAGAAQGGAPRVLAIDGNDLLEGRWTVRANFFAGSSADRGGVQLTAKDLDADGTADLVVGSGINEPATITLYSADTLDDANPQPLRVMPLDVPASPHGVNVG